ncbi:hypothetical protein BJ742DRAFT_738897 [Cladochytrium replicatum]|nr:hypothetical protein BJ742DRAFT_738897 [Cladochytrium replicatum]
MAQMELPTQVQSLPNTLVDLLAQYQDLSKKIENCTSFAAESKLERQRIVVQNLIDNLADVVLYQPSEDGPIDTNNIPLNLIFELVRFSLSNCPGASSIEKGKNVHVEQLVSWGQNDIQRVRFSERLLIEVEITRISITQKWFGQLRWDQASAGRRGSDVEKKSRKWITANENLGKQFESAILALRRQIVAAVMVSQPFKASSSLLSIESLFGADCSQGSPLDPLFKYFRPSVIHKHLVALGKDLENQIGANVAQWIDRSASAHHTHPKLVRFISELPWSLAVDQVHTYLKLSEKFIRVAFEELEA